MPLLSALPPPALVAGCATPPHGKVLVLAGVDAWDIHPTVDTAELDRMAKGDRPRWRTSGLRLLFEHHCLTR